jgi:hypothetical protein
MGGETGKVGAFPYLVSERLDRDHLQEQCSQILNCAGILKWPNNATLPLAWAANPMNEAYID